MGEADEGRGSEGRKDTARPCEMEGESCEGSRDPEAESRGEAMSHPTISRDIPPVPANGEQFKLGHYLKIGKDRG